MKPLLARKYKSTNPRGWWMSEKLDGVRAIWTGSEFISRNGKVFPVPASKKKTMPSGVVLDGELYGGRGKFQATVGKIRKGDLCGVTFMVFDLISDDVFETRYEALNALKMPSWCKVVKHSRCNSFTHLESFERKILAAGGEGVMLRERKSKYIHGRSNSLLKVKRFRNDEAEVVGYKKGKGKHANRIGALVVKFAGEVFKLGTGLSDDDRENPPRIGSMVTFSFFELSDGGVPRFPVFGIVRDYE